MLPWVYSVIYYRWGQNVVRAKMWHTKRSRSSVSDVVTTFWLHLWSITQQKHRDLESVLFLSHDKKMVISSVCLFPYGSKVRTTQNSCIVQLLCIRIKMCTERWLQLKNFSRRISYKSQHWWHWRQRYDQSPSELFCTVFSLFLFRCAIRKYRLTVTKHQPENRWPKWRWV